MKHIGKSDNNTYIFASLCLSLFQTLLGNCTVVSFWIQLELNGKKKVHVNGSNKKSQYCLLFVSLPVSDTSWKLPCRFFLDPVRAERQEKGACERQQ